MIRRKIAFLASVLVLGIGTGAYADTKSCLDNCQKAYEACLKTPASISLCLKQLQTCKGQCAAQPD